MAMCPVCFNEFAVLDSIYGILPGPNCRKRRNGLNLPAHQYDFTSDSIKEQRRDYANDIVQPFRDGSEISREYLDLYGDKYIQVTDKQKKQAKPTTDKYYND